MPSWRALQVRSRLEPLANEALKALSIDTFFPRRIVRSHRRGSPLSERPFFPGYIFADLEKHHISVIISARAVISVVAGAPIPVPVMQELRARADDQGIIDTPLTPGAFYRLHRPGVLGKILVRLQRIDEARRARVLVRLLGMDCSTLVALSDLGEQADPRDEEVRPECVSIQ